MLCPWEVCWLITGVVQYSRSQSSLCPGSLEQRNLNVSPSWVVLLDTAYVKPVLRKVFALTQWHSWDFSQGSRNSDLSYTSCFSFYYISPIRGLAISVDLCCDVVSLSFLPTSAFLQSSFKGPTYSPTNLSAFNCFCGLCTKYIMAGIGMTPPLLVLSACNLCCLFPGINPLEVFGARCVSWSHAKDLRLYIVVYVVFARWPLRIISLLCASPAGVWCSAQLDFIQKSSVCVIIALRAPALKEIHHVPACSLPLHSSPKK